MLSILNIYMSILHHSYERMVYGTVDAGITGKHSHPGGGSVSNFKVSNVPVCVCVWQTLPLRATTN